MEIDNDSNVASQQRRPWTRVSSSAKSHRFSQSTSGQSERDCSSQSEKETWLCSTSRSIASCGAVIW